jgi:hypothetical protein
MSKASIVGCIRVSVIVLFCRFMSFFLHNTNVSSVVTMVTPRLPCSVPLSKVLQQPICLFIA